MVPYVRGEQPIIFTAERERDIRGVVKFVDDMKLKGIILGGQEAWKAADDLKKTIFAVIYTNIYNLPVRDDDAYDYLFEAPSKMQAAGIKFCISTGDDRPEVRDLPYHAGLAGAFGLSKEDALKSVTLYPARSSALPIEWVRSSRQDRECRRHRRRYARTADEHQVSVHRRTDDPADEPAYELFDSFKDRKGYLTQSR